MLGASYGAKLLVLEHRFYGDSQPFTDWTEESLRYLSAEQALADAASFLAFINGDDSLLRQNVIIGGSYPGALSSWMRTRYPHLTVAAWSSSGVIQPNANFSEFDNQIYVATNKSSPDCSRAIQENVYWVQNEGWIREGGDSDNVITQYLAGSENSDMPTDDFMFYYADIFVINV
jgi:hypothetical protein